MNKQIRTVLLPLAAGILIAQTAYAGSSISVKPIKDNNRDSKEVIASASSDQYVISRSASGERIVDMTNPEHEKFVYDRLAAAGVTAEKFPQLYKEHAQLKLKQQIAKAFPDSSNTLVAEDDADGIIKNSLFFTDNNYGIAEDNGKAYVYVKARSSVFGGTKSTYADIMLEDADGNQIAPAGATLNYGEGKNTNVISIVSLDSLRKSSPDLTEIVASSYVKVTLADGTVQSKIKYTRFPFSWKVMNEKYPSSNTASTLAGSETLDLSPTPEYIAAAPIDINKDGVIKVCLNRAHTDCDYPYDQSLPNASTLVQIPFSGTMKVNHKISKIWATGELPPGMDEDTNIYIQEGIYGGVSKPSYATMDNGTPKDFSDYIKILEVNDVNKTTTLQWDIPRKEGVFGNALLFSNRDEVLWNITIAVAGFPFFEEGPRGRPSNFQISLSSETNERFGAFYAPVLKKLKFGYSCLAKGSMVTMANGKKKAIEDIKKGDLVLGGLASNVGTAQAMSVVDVSVGIEVIPMIQVETADGHNLMLTETHPVMTANKGIVWAKELIEGDRIMTEDGSALVSSVSAEEYGDAVYNLALAPLAKSELATDAEYGLFADGLYVGDLSMQDTYNYKDQVEKSETVEEVLQRIPVEYHTDYLNSLKL